MHYNEVWTAVDKLAKLQGLSPSGLAKKAGLDATTFNKSKRLRPDGKKRWPSLESLNKITDVSGISFDQFCRLGKEDETTIPLNNAIPFIKLSKLKNCDISDKQIVSDDWKMIRFPDANENLFAVEITGNKTAPYFPDGTMLIISKNSGVRRNDKIVILKTDGDTEIKRFIRRTASTLEVADINDEKKEISLPICDIRLINRIIWASQ